MVLHSSMLDLRAGTRLISQMRRLNVPFTAVSDGTRKLYRLGIAYYAAF